MVEYLRSVIFSPLAMLELVQAITSCLLMMDSEVQDPALAMPGMKQMLQ